MPLLAVYLLYEAALALLEPKPIDESLVGIGIILVSIILTLGLVCAEAGGKSHPFGRHSG